MKEASQSTSSEDAPLEYVQFSKPGGTSFIVVTVLKRDLNLASMTAFGDNIYGLPMGRMTLGCEGLAVPTWSYSCFLPIIFLLGLGGRDVLLGLVRGNKTAPWTCFSVGLSIFATCKPRNELQPTAQRSPTRTQIMGSK